MGVYVGGQLHVFGGGSHYLIDSVTGNVTQHKIGKKGWIFPYAFVQKTRNSIIIEKSDDFRNSILYEYSLEEQECTPLMRSKTNAISCSGAVSTLVDRFVVRFGGEDRNSTDQILVFDFRTQSVFESEIKCPIPSRYHAVSLGSKEQDELVVFGFINQSYKDSNLRNVQSLPIHIIQMMCKWYCN